MSVDTATPDTDLCARGVSSAQRIVVLGCPGAGKSTLAVPVAVATLLPLISLDDEYWGPNWQRTPTGAWFNRQSELVAGARWIIEGNYWPTVAVRLARTDLVVLVEAPTLVCLWRVIRRAALIRLGHREWLPAHVRMQSGRVSAARDLGHLLHKILFFNRRVRDGLLAACAAAVAPPGLVLVVTTGPLARFRARRRRRTTKVLQHVYVFDGDQALGIFRRVGERRVDL